MRLRGSTSGFQGLLAALKLSAAQRKKLDKCWRELGARGSDGTLDDVARMVNLLKDGARLFEAGECAGALRAYTQALALCERTKAREFYAEAAWELHRAQLACGVLAIAPPEVKRTCAESVPMLRDEGLLADAEQAALPPLKRYAPHRACRLRVLRAASEFALRGGSEEASLQRQDPALGGVVQALRHVRGGVHAGGAQEGVPQPHAQVPPRQAECGAAAVRAARGGARRRGARAAEAALHPPSRRALSWRTTARDVEGCSWPSV